MAKFAADKHKEENERLRAEVAQMRSELDALRSFARVVAKYMDAESGPERAALTVQIINELESAGYLKEAMTVGASDSETAARVRTLNAKLNNGRGSEVLRQVAFMLDRGDRESAVYKCTLDSDKLTQYDGCLEELADLGLLNERMTVFVRGRAARRSAERSDR